MNKLNSLYFRPHFQYNSNCKSNEILDIYAPWGAII